MNELNDVWFWAKVAGMCASIVGSVKEDGTVWLSNDEKEMLKTLSEIGPREAIKLAGRDR